MSEVSIDRRPSTDKNLKKVVAKNRPEAVGGGERQINGLEFLRSSF
jgi:hypothetical protein